MTETMRAIEITEPGGPDVLQGTTRPRPQPKHGQVIIKVAYAGVNRPDCIQRAGHYPPPPGASPILGLEASGEIVAVGEGVDASLASGPSDAVIDGVKSSLTEDHSPADAFVNDLLHHPNSKVKDR